MDSKAQLVKEICTISAAFTSCTHLGRSSTRKQKLIDWYLILKVDVDSGVDVIRRRYHQLALLLHPDKNKHPDAEIAFKLVSEAYGCLSDKARRKIFNSERQEKYCSECFIQIQLILNKNKNKNKSQRQSKCEQARPKRVVNAITIREAKRRLEEECRVINSCLQAYRTSRTGFPLFDPSNPVVYPNYPHPRARVVAECHECKQYCYNHHIQGQFRRKGFESPVYELRSNCV